jgi:hypothetical protein
MAGTGWKDPASYRFTFLRGEFDLSTGKGMFDIGHDSFEVPDSRRRAAD